MLLLVQFWLQQEMEKRMPKKKELRDAVLADKDLAKEIGFGRKKRTAQDNMIAEAHDFLMSVSKKTVG